ncbi:MAG: putative DNA-binding domain-containing protein [Pontixanthobacter sp.]
MNLIALQDAFMAQVLDDGQAPPANWTPRHAAGMEIYRNAYRARLVDALRDTFERTAKWVGDDAFRQAAAHHLISRPPNSWTLDDAGHGFPETLAKLFAGDPEVAELGWLELAMHRAFVAQDAVPLDAPGFAHAASQFAEEDWANMRLHFLPGIDQREIAHDIGTLWRALASDDGPPPDIEYSLTQPAHCLVWRDGLKSVFIQIDDHEGLALALMRSGGSYGAMCDMLIVRLGEEAALAEAGAILGRWLHHGLLSSISK